MSENETESTTVVVVDVETTGLDFEDDYALEVAWENMTTGESGCFVPPHDPELVLRSASPRALEVNGYRELIMHREQDDGRELDRLFAALRGNTLAGSAPAIDGTMIAKLFRAAGHDPRPWHHRMLDIGPYAAGVLGLPQNELPGLWLTCDVLRLPGPDHSAMGDVRATVAAFRALERIAGARS